MKKSMKIKKIFSYFLGFFLIIFEKNLIKAFNLTRHEHFPEGKSNEIAALMACSKDFEQEICFLKNLQYNLQAFIKEKHDKNSEIPLNLTLDLTSPFSMIKTSKKTNKALNFSNSNGEFQGKLTKSYINLIEKSRKFEFYSIKVTKGFNYFFGKGLINLDFHSQFLLNSSGNSNVFTINLLSNSPEFLIQNSQEILTIHNKTKINWVILHEFHHYWTLKLSKFAIALQPNTTKSKPISRIFDLHEKTAILSLSSSLIAFPPAFLKEFLKFLNENDSNASCAINRGNLAIIECENLKFPLHFDHLKILLEFQGSDNVFHLNWQFLLKKCLRKSLNLFRCTLNIYESKNEFIVLGEPFFKENLWIFDRNQMKLGFFKPKITENPKNFTQVFKIDSSGNYKEMAILLMIFIAILIGIILWLVFRKKKGFFLRKKHRYKGEIINSFAKDDNDVKTSVKAFELDTNRSNNI